MKVPSLDLQKQFKEIREEIISAVTAVLDSQMVCNGPAVREFEKIAAEYCKCDAALGVSSGTDAILVSLMALDVGPGDEVITTPFTFFATVGCISRTGAKPVFVDIDPETFNIAPAAIEAAITEKTKAIMPVHLYGQSADMDAIMEIAKRHDLRVIEDAAQAVGARYKDKPIGTIGDLGAYSFYPTKNLGAMGDAGMVVTQDKQLAEKIERLRDHGQNPRYFYKMIGGNFRMDSIQGAALAIKLRYLDGWVEKRRAIVGRYNELLADCNAVTTPTEREDCFHVYHQYIIRTERRDELQAHLAEQGVASGIYYPLCLHEQECFADLGYKKGDFPESERAAAEVLALPVCPELSDEQITYVADEVYKFMA